MIHQRYIHPSSVFLHFKRPPAFIIKNIILFYLLSVSFSLCYTGNKEKQYKKIVVVLRKKKGSHSRWFSFRENYYYYFLPTFYPTKFSPFHTKIIHFHAN